MTGVASSIDATTAYLRPYVGRDEFATKATERGEAMHRLIATSTLSEDEAVNALTALHAIPWPDDIMATLVRAVQASTNLERRLVPNNTTRDYSAIPHYFTAAHWHAWLNNTRGSVDAEGQEHVIKVASGLRLKNPSEDTSQALAAMASLATYGLQNAEVLSPIEKHEFVVRCKKAVKKSKIPALSPAPPRVMELPVSANDFRDRHSAIYTSVYDANHPPVPCPVVASRLRRFIDSFPKRDTNALLRQSTVVPHGQRPHVPASGQEQQQPMVMQQLLQGLAMLIQGGRRQALEDDVPIIKFPLAASGAVVPFVPTLDDVMDAFQQPVQTRKGKRG